MDLDGDGVLSMYELEYFYTEQISKMDVLGIETMLFEDCLCQVCRLLIKNKLCSWFRIHLQLLSEFWANPVLRDPGAVTPALFPPPSFFSRLEIDSQPLGLQEWAILNK